MNGHTDYLKEDLKRMRKEAEININIEKTLDYYDKLYEKDLVAKSIILVGVLISRSINNLADNVDALRCEVASIEEIVDAINNLEASS